MKLQIFGDHHGQNDLYLEILSKIQNPKDYFGILSLGDMGIGFYGKHNLKKAPYATTFITGNRDHRQYCLDNQHELIALNYNHIDRGQVDLHKGILYLGGAWSIDKKNRVEGQTWFSDEEMSFKEEDDLLGLLLQHGDKIKTVISHDLPRSQVQKGIEGVWLSKPIETRTTRFNESILEYMPNLKKWVCGHYHKDETWESNGVEYVIVDAIDANSEGYVLEL